MRKKYKGMTVVEVVVSFALISLSLVIGMVGIACGANFVNAGARLKNQGRQTVVQKIKTNPETKAEKPMTDPADSEEEITVYEYELNGFKWYSIKEGDTP